MDEKVKILFNVTEQGIKSLRVEEYEALEMAMDGDVKMYRLRPVLCRFVINEDGSPMEFAAAMKLIGKVPITMMEGIMRGFSESLKVTAVPKENGDSSPQLSEPSVEGSPSQPG